jgi:hypothetical protein
MMAVDLVTAAHAGDIDGMTMVLCRITRIAHGLEEPESAADRRPVRIEDSEDWAATHVRRSKPKES